MNSAQNILKDLIEQLKSLTKTETIMGGPVTAGEFTLLPISRVSLGVGAGAGGGEGEMNKKAQTGEGGGGGGGIRIHPVALVAIRGSELNLHMLVPGASIGHTMEKLPDTLGKSVEKLVDGWLARKAKEGSE